MRWGEDELKAEALDAAACALILRLGDRAAQHVVDEMQAAIRAGDERTAARSEQLLRHVEQKLQGGQRRT